MAVRIPWVISLLVLALWLFSPAGYAQSGSTTGTITGRVCDASGAVIGGTEIVCLQVGTGMERTVQSREDGTYEFLNLPPGDYELRARAAGFEDKRQTIRLSLGTTALVVITLATAGTTDVIEVVADARNAAESATNVRQNEIPTLPINRRDFLQFAITAARTVPDNLPDQGATATSGISFNAQSPRLNNLTIDGLDNNDATSGSIRSTFSQEAVREFQVVSDGYSAEFGRALGGIINIITKSGDNEFRGSLFGFFRNAALSARESLTPGKPPFEQYQYGLTAGGPLWRNRAFFFVTGERLNIKQNTVVTISDTVRAAALRNGFRFDTGSIPFSTGGSTGLVRGDWQITPEDSLTVRYNYGGQVNTAFEPFGGLTASTFTGEQRLTDHNLAVNNTFVGQQALVVESRFLYSTRLQDISAADPGPRIAINAPEGQVIFGKSLVLPQFRDTQTYQFFTSVGLVRGRHQMKFGGDVLRVDSRQRQPASEGGQANFSTVSLAALGGPPGSPSMSALQAFDPTLRTPQQRAVLALIGAGLPNRFPGFPALPLDVLPITNDYRQGFLDPQPTRIPQTAWSLFALDDVSLHPAVKLNLGVRYDLTRARSTPENNGLVSPRIALVWQPLQKLTVRSGYGLFTASNLTFPIFTVVPLTRRTLVLPFPFSILPFTQPNRQLPPSGDFPFGIRPVPQFGLEFQFARRLPVSYTQQASLSLESQIGQTLFSVVYNYVRGNRILSLRTINPVVRPGVDPLDSVINGRLDPRRGTVNEYAAAYDSYYHGVTFGVERRVGRFTGRASYTLSKAIDNYVDFRTSLQEFAEPLDIGGERALSIQDARHRLVMSGVWKLDYSKHPLLRDYTLSYIFTAVSGRPWNLLAGVDLNRNGDANDRPAGLGRNAGVTPAFYNLDARLSRRFINRDRFKLEGIVEAFNLFNRTNVREFGRTFPPVNPPLNTEFNLPPRRGGRFIVTRDRYRRAFPPRQVQVGFRITF
ncbi:TonB-dependent receptor [Chloracidobacterium sp. MS 40/45]|uniref:TonB-dependent receptor n=1 Tax=Chloracidobacterium aggregatum TaxID=2851959 RepID=UPI001B8C8182|nr:TonB-dependent receptor [Chloracidobacterium aggregatum]QUW00626.1 TonB-dependent receptor [Chloracidobacterium sp. MS 40/45]